MHLFEKEEDSDVLESSSSFAPQHPASCTLSPLSVSPSSHSPQEPRTSVPPTPAPSATRSSALDQLLHVGSPGRLEGGGRGRLGGFLVALPPRTPQTVASAPVVAAAFPAPLGSRSMTARGWAPWLSLALCWALASRGATGSACAPCQPELCALVQCAVPELTARDECGCCERCLSAEGERCGGTRGARCGPGLVCVSQRRAGAAPEADAEEGTGHCVCKEDGAVCGSDGRSYSSVCALHLHSWRALLDGRERVRKAHDGECKLGEPRGARGKPRVLLRGAVGA